MCVREQITFNLVLSSVSLVYHKVECQSGDTDISNCKYDTGGECDGDKHVFLICGDDARI